MRDAGLPVPHLKILLTVNLKVQVAIFQPCTKDLNICLSMAEKLGVPLHTASTAMQLFHAGKTKYPEGDNWVVTRVLEEIVGAELHR